MEATSLKITNFKGLESFECDINPFETYFAGPNQSGKTSAIDALFFAVRGVPPDMHKKDCSQLIGKWGASATTELRIEDGEKIYIIKRRILKTTIQTTVTDGEGKGVIGPDVDDLLTDALSPYAYDLMQFINAKPKEQAALIGVDTDEIDGRITAQKELVSDANKNKLRTGKLLADIPEVDKDEVKPVDVAALMEEFQTISAQHRECEAKKELRSIARKSIDDIDAEIRLLKSERGKREKTLEDNPALIKMAGLDENREKFAGAKATNEAATLYERYKNIAEENKTAQIHWQQESDAYGDLLSEKNQIIESQNPFRGSITFDENGGLLVNGAPLSFNHLNHAEAVRMALRLLTECQKNKLNLYYIRGGKDFDMDDSGKILMLEKFKGDGVQFVSEVVCRTKPEYDAYIMVADEPKGDKL